MGTFSVTIGLSADDGRVEELEALVDTGAMNTMMPADLLQRLGVQPHRRSVFQPADGREMQMEIGRAWVSVTASGNSRRSSLAPPVASRYLVR